MANDDIVYPSLRDVLVNLKREIGIEINCHAIATVQVFNSELQTIEATINYAKAYSKKNSSGEFVEFAVDYPILLDCPVVVMGGGGGSVTFPILKGDQCLILFNDRNMDTWISGSNNSIPASGRLHDLSDGIAIVGLRTVDHAYDMERSAIQQGTAKVGVGKDDKVLIENSTATLKSVIDSMVTALDTFATATSAAAIEPTLGPAAVALKASLVTVSTSIGDLLE